MQIIGKCKFYDGIRPGGSSGQCRVQSRSVLFLKSKDSFGEQVEIPYSDIIGMDFVKNEIRLTCKSTDELSETRLLVIPHQKSVYEYLLQRYQNHSNNPTGKYIPHHRDQWSTVLPVFGVLATVAILIVWGFIAAIHNVYRLIPLEADRQLGMFFGNQVERQYTICEDEAVNTEMTRILNRLVKERDDTSFQYSVKVIKSPEVNAFALPGGRIYFFSKLLEDAESKEEVAGILAHEMSHVDRRHGVQSLVRSFGYMFLVSTVVGAGFDGAQWAELMTETGSTLLLLKYSRDFENQADRDAISSLVRSGIDAGGFISFFSRLNGQDGEEIPVYLSTHPHSKDRVQNAVSFIEQEKHRIGQPIRPMGDSAGWNHMKYNCSMGIEEYMKSQIGVSPEDIFGKFPEPVNR